jgi:SAM-dependent methyltransferase
MMASEGPPPRGIGILVLCWRQWRTERTLRRRGIHFRSTNPEAVAQAYARISDQEFQDINARQDWANRRTIPRALDGRLLERPLLALDLGCGTGSSTAVLASSCPSGSTIVGYDVADSLLAQAQRRQYRYRDGTAACVQFVAQCLTAPLRLPGGELVKNASADLLCTSGVLGHHFTPENADVFFENLARVSRWNGLALLDSGPTFPPTLLREVAARHGFEFLSEHRSFIFAHSSHLLFRRAL